MLKLPPIAPGLLLGLAYSCLGPTVGPGLLLVGLRVGPGAVFTVSVTLCFAIGDSGIQSARAYVWSVLESVRGPFLLCFTYREF